MKNCCSTESCQNEAEATQCNCGCSNQGSCQCGSECECPIECASEKWQKSFCKAMGQAQTEILKAKILKAWGPMMDKVADALLETMGAVWQEKVAEVRAAEAKQAFKQKIHDAWLQESKK